MKHSFILLALLTGFSSQAYAGGGDINVMKAGREDISAFDDMLGKSQKSGAAGARNSAARASLGATVSAEAQKVRDDRQRAAQNTRSFGQWVKSQNRPDSKGSSASMGDTPGDTGGGAQGAYSKVTPANNSGNSNGNSGNHDH
jgi:hypothetical protein